MDDVVLTDALRARIEAHLRADRVVLFMKGTRSAPRCGFSGRVVEALDGLLDAYATVDVLGDMTLREGVKVYSRWPTFPQLYVDGELVGGADIVEQLQERGELAAVVGASEVKPPAVTVTDAARDRIREVLGGEDLPLRLRIDARFQYQFESVDVVRPGEASVNANGVILLFDPASARRADGMTLDYVEGPQGAGLVVDNPNEPAGVQPLAPETLQDWMQRGEAFHLVDVRTDDEWALARIEGARLLTPETEAWLDALPRDARLVFQCHHGVRSQHAAEHFLGRGFTRVFNLSGGIDAWSRRVDPAVPRY